MKSKNLEKHNGHSKNGYVAYQTKQISELISSRKLNLAKLALLELLKEYPDDFVTKLLMAEILMKENKYQEAKEVLEELPQEMVYQKLVPLYIKLGEEKLKELYQKYFMIEQESELNNSRYHCERIYLNKKYNPDYKEKGITYFEKQIINYNEQKAIQHIKENHFLKIKLEKTKFYQDVDIEQLFYQAKQYINTHRNASIIVKDIIEDYIFYYPECGYQENNTRYDYFKVSTFINTSKIITMLPISIASKFDTEICKLENQEAKKKVKVRNGLERFNSRYNQCQ